MAKIKPNQHTAPTEHITITVDEYAYLQKLEVLLDILLGDGDYSTFRNVAAVRQSIREMKQRRQAGGEE
jgi:hypothetical protein